LAVRTSSSSPSPVRKVGLVLVRHLDSNEPQVLLVKPKPDPEKENYNPHEPVPFVLPRGSRQYLKPGAPKDSPRESDWEDARDEATARRYSGRLEKTSRTLLREMQEEAGIPPKVLRKELLFDLEVQSYRRQGKAPIAIHWYGCIATDSLLDAIDPRPADTQAMRWATVSEMKAMAAAGQAREGYIGVAEAAIETLRSRSAPPVRFPALHSR
jgi:8-oxo-dGTP pyrophosphatase MutT (NUDIX family)